LEWFAELPLNARMAGASVAAPVGGTIFALLASRQANRRNRDQQYFIEFSRR
jgi:hypothetical protein